jgi:hypothetical protein
MATASAHVASNRWSGAALQGEVCHAGRRVVVLSLLLVVLVWRLVAGQRQRVAAVVVLGVREGTQRMARARQIGELGRGQFDVAVSRTGTAVAAAVGSGGGCAKKAQQRGNLCESRKDVPSLQLLVHLGRRQRAVAVGVHGEERTVGAAIAPALADLGPKRLEEDLRVALGGRESDFLVVRPRRCVEEESHWGSSVRGRSGGLRVLVPQACLDALQRVGLVRLGVRAHAAESFAVNFK